MHWLLPIGLITFLLLIRSIRKWQARGGLPLPPGPRGYPVIGNLLDLPAVMPWKTYRDLSNAYGDLVYLNLPSRPTVILGSANTCHELFERRSDIYSDKHVSTMMKLTGWDFSFAFMPYTPRWRAHRRSFHRFFNERATRQWRSIQIEETRMFLRRLLADPKDIGEHTRLVLSAMILRIVYGLRITSSDDDYIRVVREAMEGLNLVVVPGSCWIDYLPILQNLPKWFPGATWKKTAMEIRAWVEAMKLDPVKPIMHNKNKGDHDQHCFVSASFARMQKCQHPEERAAQQELTINVAALAYAAGADTTHAALQFFFAAMTLYPHVQKAAQAELDAVLGPHRLPDFDDYDSEKLVYFHAVVMESLRWQVALPYGAPHRTTRDDEYNGYFIPAGTEIIANAWALLHNPDHYPEPYEFKPERYIKDGKLDPNAPDPNTIAYGFGRRICPGRHLANATLFITIASTLHTFNIEPKEGERFDPDTMITTGFISGPTKVPCILTPRSEDAKRLILSSFTSE